MKSNQMLIAILLAAIVLISACGQPQAQVKIQATPFAGGNNGLVMSFLPGQPPAEIPENTEFTIAVNVENKGEKDIAQDAAGFDVEGIDPAQFNNFVASKTNSALTGTRKTQAQTIPGGQEILQYTGLKRNVTAGDYLTFPIKVVAQYPYETKTLGMVCLKQSVVQAVAGGSEICKLIQDVKPQNTGAPIQVAAISQLPSGLKVVVKNVGGGIPYYVSGFSKDTSIDYGNKGRVHIKSAKIGSTDIVPSTKCAPSTLYLINNEATTFCTYDFAKASGTYTEVMELVLEYGYRQEISTSLKITNI